MTARMLWLKAKLPVESTPSSQTISQHSKYTVTWRQMVVGGQCSSAEWMDLLTSIATGLTIDKVLET